MKWLYRIGLVVLGCYLESALRNVSGIVLYWAGKGDLLQGFVPYLVPVALGYLCVLDLEKHWSDVRLKNDIMGYTVSVLLLGYPTLITLSLLINSAPGDPLATTIRGVALSLLVLGILVVFLVARRAVRRGVPLSFPWGTESGVVVESDESGESGESGDDLIVPEIGLTELEAPIETEPIAEAAEAPRKEIAEDAGNVPPEMT